jgi:hypothetical protein
MVAEVAAGSEVVAVEEAGAAAVGAAEVVAAEVVAAAGVVVLVVAAGRTRKSGRRQGRSRHPPGLPERRRRGKRSVTDHRPRW